MNHDMTQPFRIGELARRADCPVETIRYYEQNGLLPRASRSAGNFRLYDEAHLDRLLFVRRCRSLDMTLDAVRRLLRVRDDPTADCAEVNALVDEHIERVASRIRDLELLERQLAGLRQRCAVARASVDCGILRGLRDGHVKVSATSRRAARRQDMAR